MYVSRHWFACLFESCFIVITHMPTFVKRFFIPFLVLLLDYFLLLIGNFFNNYTTENTISGLLLTFVLCILRHNEEFLVLDVLFSYLAV